MRLLHVCALGLVAASVAACSHDTSGTLVTPDPVAGLRFVSAVPDTTGIDFRVVDVVNNAPNTVNATFRTGGSPYGIGTNFLPPYFAVMAGTREIKAFHNSSNPAISSTVLLDTTFTFVQGMNYTVYLYGYTETQEPQPAAPAAAASAGIGVDTTAAHMYKVTFVTAAGETMGSPHTAGIKTNTTNGRVSLTAIPIGDVAVTARKIYRTAAGDTVAFKLVGTLANNTGTAFTDSIADASLGAAIPTANTTAKPRATPAVNAIITTDSVPTLAAKKIAMRVLNLIPTTAGAPSPSGNVDIWFVPQATVAPFPGTATFSNLGFGGLTTYYVNQDSLSTLKIAATATGTNTPALVSANLQAGTLGTATADPIPGGGIPGSGFTAVLVPQSVVSSSAPQTFTTPTVIYLTDQKPPRTAP